MKNFCLIGAAGYIAPRHMQAIIENESNLIAAYDINDSVGVIDKYAPEAEFFTEFQQYENYLKGQLAEGNKINYTSICSPNNFHFDHIVHGLKIGSDVICEKPLVLTIEELKKLKVLEQKYQKKIYTLLQLRHHPSIINLKKNIEKTHDKSFDVDLSYITSRGNWYYKSWKGNDEISGGIATNIGIHFFDMLCFVFGDPKHYELHFKNEGTIAGYLELEKARVRWILSIDRDNLPTKLDNNQRTFRSIKVDGTEFEFSDGFTDLHTESYKNILSGNGFGIDEAEKSIKIVEDIRDLSIEKNELNFHPSLKGIIK